MALGRTGIVRRKREGDGHTPAGRFRLLSVLYRPDRGPRPQTAIPVTALTPDMGWCDDPADRAYNRPVKLPHPGRHERLWRDDHLYDLIVVVDFNMHPVVRDKGSAIFLHLARDNFGPTEGCVAMAPQAMRRLLRHLTTNTIVDIG